MTTKQEEKIVAGPADGASVFTTEDARSVVARPATMTPAHGGYVADTYAVAVNVLRIAPAWLLFISVAFVLLTLLLGWVRPGADASGEAYLSPNDSKVAATVPAASPSPTMPAAKQERQADAVAQTSNAGNASPAANARVESAAPTPTPATQASQSNDAVNAGQRFTVQVGSHSDESSANEQTSHLRSAGFDARTVTAELPGRGKWFRVQAGSFDDRAAAAKVVAAMRSKGVAADAIVVPKQ